MTTSVRERHQAGEAAPDATPARPAALAGVLAAGVVFGSGIVLCAGLSIIVWLASDTGSAGAAVRAGAGIWLAGHGSGVTVGATTIAIVPLGVPTLAAVGLAVASRRLTDGGSVVAHMAGAAVAYGSAAAVTALVATTSEVSFSAVRAGLIAFVLAGLAAGIGVTVADGSLRERWDAAPEVLRGVVRGCAWSLLVMLGAAAALVAFGLVIGFHDVDGTFGALGPGLLGGAALVLLCVLLLPNAALLASALLLGPGFAIGSDTSVTLTDVRLGDLPTVPLLAALPDAGAQPAWVAALGVIPVLAGVVGGVVSVRGAEADGSLYDSLTRGCMAGGAAGVLLGLAVMGAGGAAGPGRMAEVGAVVWCVPVAVVALAVGGTAGAALGHYRERRS